MPDRTTDRPNDGGAGSAAIALADGALRGLALGPLFEQAPGFVAILLGADHRFAFGNPRYAQLIGGREVIGRTVAEALPEAAGQGYLELLDGVFASGVPYNAVGHPYGMQVAPDG